MQVPADDPYHWYLRMLHRFNLRIIRTEIIAPVVNLGAAAAALLQLEDAVVRHILHAEPDQADQLG